MRLRIEAARPMSPRTLELVLAPAGFRARPGQYVRVGREQSPLVLASGPGEPPMLLLGPEAQAKLAVVAGEELELSEPLGPGFALEAARGREVLVFAVGTAQAAARALLQAIAQDRAAFGRVRAYLGARAAEEHAYGALEPAWRANGIEVSRAVSRPHVHELFLADAPPSPEARAFAAGHPPMIASLREALAARGGDPATLGTNH